MIDTVIDTIRIAPENKSKNPATKKAVIQAAECVACGTCIKACPMGALSIPGGTVVTVDYEKCIGCGKCLKACPASIIKIESQIDDGRNDVRQKKSTRAPVKHRKHWYDYLWIASTLYLVLGFFNILFAWLGLLCFMIPLMISIAKGNKAYCNKYCGRGQLFQLIGGKLGISSGRSVPKWLRSKWFRYGFLTFFMTMFILMLFNTYMVFSGAQSLHQTVTLLWTFHLPWNWVNTSMVTPWVAQFAFGFYSLMLTSTILGLFTMLLFKPRSWCVYCPMGTMTQGICQLKS